MPSALVQLRSLHARLDGCTACPKMIRPVVHGPALLSPVYLLGQAPGPHEAKFGRPFAWTAGKRMFGWFQDAFGVDEETFRARVYMAAVARCFPGKDAPGGAGAAGGGRAPRMERAGRPKADQARGDRKPDPTEIEACRPFIAGETSILKPELVLPVGTLAIEQVLGVKSPLAEVVGRTHRARWHGLDVDVICLPHPSGASTWHHRPDGKKLLARSLARIGAHPAWRRALAAPARRQSAAT